MSRNTFGSYGISTNPSDILLTTFRSVDKKAVKEYISAYRKWSEEDEYGNAHPLEEIKNEIGLRDD